MDSNLAIDLSVRSLSQNSQNCHSQNASTEPVRVVRPIPRLPWTITWYQSIWPIHQNQNHYSNSNRFLTKGLEMSTDFLKDGDAPRARTHPVCTLPGGLTELRETVMKSDSIRKMHIALDDNVCAEGKRDLDKDFDPTSGLSSLTTVLDIACCDGPVMFERVSNPNFALTVEHKEEAGDKDDFSKMGGSHLALKTYLCIYCNQSFKSLFCYQKHKKRHLNPVSVDITATHTQDVVQAGCTKDRSTTKDLNVQFFPCKKCGCKFPSYYFVHKHRKVCHVF